jgi:hypothetical protein
VDNLSTVVGRLIDALEASALDYAFGGALALAAWSEPRATADIDLVVWVDPSALTPLITVLRSAGVTVEDQAATAEGAERGMFVGWAGPIRVDVFLPSIPFYAVAATRRVRTQMAGRSTWIHSAEVLAVFKLLFFRPKDLLDVERMLQVQGSRFDRGFVRAALAQLLSDDPRIAAWDRLCAQVP